MITSALSQPVFATSIAHHENTISSNKIVFDAPIIPKPKFLPGPDETEQKASDEANAGGARGSLVDTILPFFGVTLVGLTGGIALVFLIISGVRFVTSYGNEEDIKKAKDQAMWAIIGFVVALLSYAVVTIIINLEIIKKS